MYSHMFKNCSQPYLNQQDYTGTNRKRINLQVLTRQSDSVIPHTKSGSYENCKKLSYFVYLPNDKMLNEEIVRAGYANVKTIPPNVKYEDRFLNAFKYAEETERGLWDENK